MLQWLGIKPDDYVDEENDVFVWPENVEAVNFFSERCATQWVVGMSGATGLNNSSVIDTIKLYYSKKKRQRKMLEDIQLIERGALSAMAERRKKEENDRKK